MVDFDAVLLLERLNERQVPRGSEGAAGVATVIVCPCADTCVGSAIEMPAAAPARNTSRRDDRLIPFSIAQFPLDLQYKPQWPFPLAICCPTTSS